MNAALKKITSKNFDAVMAAARSELGTLAVPCTDGKIRIWRSGSSVPTEIYEVHYARSGYTFKLI